MAQATSNQDQKQSIAVVAIHGVADQKPGSTLYAAAGLLSGRGGGKRYSEFVEQDLRLFQQPVIPGDRVAIAKGSDAVVDSLLGSNVSKALTRPRSQLGYDSGRVAALEQMSADEVEIESMREQLQDFHHDAADNQFGTRVLHGKRQRRPGEDQVDNVDLYEVHWADLSRLKNSFFSAFFEFYLFMFFFSRLGGIALERVAATVPRSHSLRLTLNLHVIAEWALVVGVPVTNLCMFSLVASGLPMVAENFLLPESLQFKLIGSAIVVGLIVCLGFAIAGISGTQGWFGGYLLVTMVLLGLIYAEILPIRGLKVTAFLIWTMVALVLIRLCKAYDKRRGGALYFALFMFGITGAIFFILLWSDDFAVSVTIMLDRILNRDGATLMTMPVVVGGADASEEIFNRGVVGVMFVMLFNIVAWLVFVLGALANSIAGFIAGRSEVAGDSVRAAIWTAMISLVLPGICVMLVTFFLWESINWLSKSVIGDSSYQLLRNLVDLNIFPNLPNIMLALGLGIGFAIWLLVPAVLSELAKPGSRSEKEVKKLGESLTRGYAHMRWSGELFRILLIVAIPLDWFYLVIAQPPLTEQHRSLVFVMGLGVIALFFCTQGPLRVVTGGLRNGLDIALDVTNWLRLKPVNNNVRSNICRRYASLLRHISNWKDPQTGRGYDAVVIVAHSQGTVITADLLRFLQHEQNRFGQDHNNDGLHRFFTNNQPLPLYLFTFGSPLRQLFSQRFPFQYGWAGARSIAPGSTASSYPVGPDPKSLGLKYWSNAYCSGDYIGRYLWFREDDPDRWAGKWSEGSQYSSFYPNTRERCVGYGGHGRYWSGQIEPVAEELDRLIAMAINK